MRTRMADLPLKSCNRGSRDEATIGSRTTLNGPNLRRSSWRQPPASRTCTAECGPPTSQHCGGLYDRRKLTPLPHPPNPSASVYHRRSRVRCPTAGRLVKAARRTRRAAIDPHLRQRRANISLFSLSERALSERGGRTIKGISGARLAEERAEYAEMACRCCDARVLIPGCSLWSLSDPFRFGRLDCARWSFLLGTCNVTRDAKTRVLVLCEPYGSLLISKRGCLGK